MKFNNTLMDCVRADVTESLIPMLLGEPGIGKSAWVEDLANRMHTKCFTLACNQLAEKADLTGARLVPIDNPTASGMTHKQMFFPHDVISQAIDYAIENPNETPILFMDELNRTTPDVTSAALSIPTLKAIGSIKLPKNLRVICAGNDKGHVTSLDDASVSRFVLYRVEPDYETFCAVNPDLNTFIKNVLVRNRNLIFCKPIVMPVEDEDGNITDSFIEDILDEGEGMHQFTTPRTISALSRWLNRLDRNTILELIGDAYVEDGQQRNAMQDAIEGHVGSTEFAAELLSEIAQNIMTTSSIGGAISIDKPSIYDKLKACQTVDALEKEILNCTERDRAACFVYALYEKADNVRLIECLANNITDISSETTNLMALSLAKRLDVQNVTAFLSMNTALTATISTILSETIA